MVETSVIDVYTFKQHAHVDNTASVSYCTTGSWRDKPTFQTNEKNEQPEFGAKLECEFGLVVTANEVWIEVSGGFLLHDHSSRLTTYCKYLCGKESICNLNEWSDGNGIGSEISGQIMNMACQR